MRQIRFLIVLLVMAWANVSGAQTETEKLLAESDPAIQAQIAAVFDSKSEVEFFQQIQTLKKMTDDKALLVKQLAIFAASPTTQEGRPLEARAVLEGLDLTRTVVIRALAPYLNTDNENLRSFVKDWFQYHDECGSGPSSLQCLNYYDYLEYARGQLKRNEELPAAFIEYIYEKSPDRALLIFTLANPQQHAELIARLQEMHKDLDPRLRQDNERRGGIPPVSPPKEVKPQGKVLGQQADYDRREILLAERLVGNAIRLKGFEEQFQKALPEAKEQLIKLAEHKEWWARLYVAEIMRRHRELRLPDIQKKLREDSNELVSKAARGELGRAPVPRVAPGGAVPLVAPKNVEARAVGAGSVRVDWQASVGATSYDVQRRRPDTEKEFTTIARGIKETTYTDSKGESGILYDYRVVANGPEEAQPKAGATNGP